MANCEKCETCEYGTTETRESFPIKDWENSPRVYALQNMLHYLGFDQGRDGTYGPVTKGNLKTFQQLYGHLYGLEVDGIPNAPTMAALAKECIYKENK